MIVLYHLRIRIQEMKQLEEQLRSIDFSQMDAFKGIYDISKGVYAKIADGSNPKCVFNF